MIKKLKKISGKSEEVNDLIKLIATNMNKYINLVKNNTLVLGQYKEKQNELKKLNLID